MKAPVTLEVDLYRALLALLRRPGPHVLVSALPREELIALLMREANVFHAVEAQEAAARAAELQERARTLADEPGEAHAMDAAVAARVEEAKHLKAAQLERAAVEALLARYSIVHDDSAVPREDSIVVLLGHGWSQMDEPARVEARREFLGR